MPNKSHESQPEKQHPAIDSLISNPAGFEALLKSATSAERAQIESVLSDAMKRHQSEESSSKEARYAAAETRIQTLLTFLSPELDNFKGGEKDLKAILQTFCTENNLMLLPKIGDAIAVRPGVEPDWESDDGKYAVKIMPDAIQMYKEGPNGLWMPFTPR